MPHKNRLIESLQLEPLTGEGGYFRRIYESDEKTDTGRRFAASIYYMLEAPDFSCFHRLDCDELWHFYAGDVLVLHQILPDGTLVQMNMGHPSADPAVTPFTIVKKGSWFAAEVREGGQFSLVGCTTTPEFLYEKFEAPSRHDLTLKFPQHADLIARLTRY